ncbi:unnamed protein product [Anisakis simplex]|uniref:Neurogenic locus notch homolog protein 1 (inferred by orthology to a zebrafish protein) n=1 Tax=Anisakis simplex TaxID=6269 RepID=A0A0M3KBZ8_ANISI|nr:unnamed protein product [Anisakis simplex]
MRTANLLDAGALLDELDDHDSSALILAVKAGRCAVVRGLLELGADAGVEDANCRTALHHAAALCALPIQEMCGVEMAQLLVQAGADVNADGRRVAPDYSGRTALHYAAQLLEGE